MMVLTAYSQICPSRNFPTVCLLTVVALSTQYGFLCFKMLYACDMYECNIGYISVALCSCRVVFGDKEKPSQLCLYVSV